MNPVGWDELNSLPSVHQVSTRGEHRKSGNGSFREDTGKKEVKKVTEIFMSLGTRIKTARVVMGLQTKPKLKQREKMFLKKQMLSFDDG